MGAGGLSIKTGVLTRRIWAVPAPDPLPGPEPLFLITTSTHPNYASESQLSNSASSGYMPPHWENHHQAWSESESGTSLRGSESGILSLGLGAHCQWQA